MGMEQAQIDAVAAVLQRWDPLGPKAAQYHGLKGYEAEAIDISRPSVWLDKPRNPSSEPSSARRSTSTSPVQTALQLPRKSLSCCDDCSP